MCRVKGTWRVGKKRKEWRRVVRRQEWRNSHQKAKAHRLELCSLLFFFAKGRETNSGQCNWLRHWCHVLNESGCMTDGWSFATGMVVGGRAKDGSQLIPLYPLLWCLDIDLDNAVYCGNGVDNMFCPCIVLRIKIGAVFGDPVEQMVGKLTNMANVLYPSSQRSVLSGGGYHTGHSVGQHFDIEICVGCEVVVVSHCDGSQAEYEYQLREAY